MTMVNQFLAFGVGTSPNTYSYSVYAASSQLGPGYVAGTADAQHVNTVLRQVSVAVAGIGKLIADYGALDALDDGVPANFEAALKSALDAIVAGQQFWKPGDIKATIVNAVPAGWLKANGAIVSRATYAALFAALGTTYGAGDGSTTFQLPDYRGRVPRGFSDGATLDSGRAIGSLQDDQLLAHSHNLRMDNGGGGNPSTPVTGQVRATDRGVYNNTLTEPAGTGAEVRVHNFAALILIKT